MAAARANTLPDLVRYDLRPTLVEARLITEKHACDAAYVGALSAHLPDINWIRATSSLLCNRLRRIEETSARMQ